MVRTGARAEALKALLSGAGWQPARSAPPRARLDSLRPELAEAVTGLYRVLGGRADPLLVRPGGWDLAFEDGVVVELDEELHFNRYRRLSLEADWCSGLPWRDEYVKLCHDREPACLAAGRWGRRWTNPSCEAMFGPADSPGDFAGNGAPRWKQRALYDAVKDAFALDGDGVRLVRLATHDRVDGVELGAALEGRATVDLEALDELVRRRGGAD